MTEDWGGAQWVLATVLIVSVIAPPILRAGLVQSGYAPKTSWPEFWGRRVADLIEKAALVAILYWGGFW